MIKKIKYQIIQKITFVFRIFLNRINWFFKQYRKRVKKTLTPFESWSRINPVDKDSETMEPIHIFLKIKPLSTQEESKQGDVVRHLILFNTASWIYTR
jgi:hypothetical protein